MTKQQKIREGMAKYLREHDGIICCSEIECGETDCCECQSEGLLTYLHSQGVVIKVERELPPLSKKVLDILDVRGLTPLVASAIPKALFVHAQDLQDAGFTAVEPLIKE